MRWFYDMSHHLGLLFSKLDTLDELNDFFEQAQNDRDNAKEGREGSKSQERTTFQERSTKTMRSEGETEYIGTLDFGDIASSGPNSSSMTFGGTRARSLVLRFCNIDGI